MMVSHIKEPPPSNIQTETLPGCPFGPPTPVRCQSGLKPLGFCARNKSGQLLGDSKMKRLIGCRGLVPADQNLSLSRMVSSADQALLFHAFDEGRGAVIADAEPP